MLKVGVLACLEAVPVAHNFSVLQVLMNLLLSQLKSALFLPGKWSSLGLVFVSAAFFVFLPGLVPSSSLP